MNNFDVTSCQILNKYNNIFINLCVEWLNVGLKFTVFVPDSIPLIGQIDSSEIDKFSKDSSKTREEYLEITREIFSGKYDGIEFILEGMKFRWKKGPWNYGMIELKEAKLEEVFFNLLTKFINRHEQLEKILENMKAENKELRESKNQQISKLEKIMTIKHAMEEDLYKRFIVVLNSKKKKIRELEEELKKTKNNGNSNNNNKIYDAETDQEESEAEVERKDEPNHRKSDIFKPRKAASSDEEREKYESLKRHISDSEGNLIDSEYEDDNKNNEKNCKYNGGIKTADINSAKASTSKNSDEIKIKSSNINDNLGRSVPNFESGESEEDMFA